MTFRLPVWMRRDRYQAVIVGLESGNRLPLSLMRFKTEQDAYAWCLRMNQALGDHLPLTRWTYEEIPR